MTDCLAIVVTYNRKEKLKKNLASLAAQTRKVDVLVVDNASTDGTKEVVGAFLRPGVAYINTGANLGGAGGFSFGIREGYKRGYGAFWIMDDDCIPEENALEELMAAEEMIPDRWGFLSSVAYFTDGSICNMNIQKTGIRALIDDYTSPVVPVMMATFVSLYFKREIVREFGLPIKEFFIWTDDLEYTRRISRRLPCFAVPKSRVVHEMASNAKVNIAVDSEERITRYRYLYRNEVYVYRREGIRGWLYLWCRVALHSARILFSGTGKKTKKFITVWQSFFSGFTFHPAVEFPEEEND